MYEYELTGQVVDSAFKVHTVLGPGLLESSYEACLEFELRRRGLSVERQVALPLVYEGFQLADAYRLDLLVQRKVIVEVKAVSATLPIHQAQLVSYLRLAKKRVGLLMNFHVLRLRDGIQRFVN